MTNAARGKRRTAHAGIQIVATLLAMVACTDLSVIPTSPRVAAPLASKSPPSPPPVPSTIYDADALGNLLLTRSDDYNGTGFATYSGQLNSLGGWQLVLNGQKIRTLYLVLASQGIAGAPDGYYSSSVETYVRCFDQSGTRVTLQVMSAGASNGNCTFGQDFSAGRTKYKLAMGPDYDADSPTGRATVTCNAVSNGSCNNWTVTPNPSTATTFTLSDGRVVSAPVANLYVFNNNGTLTFAGSYHNSYSIRIAQ